MPELDYGDIYGQYANPRLELLQSAARGEWRCLRCLDTLYLSWVGWHHAWPTECELAIPQHDPDARAIERGVWP